MQVPAAYGRLAIHYGPNRVFVPNKRLIVSFANSMGCLGASVGAIGGSWKIRGSWNDVEMVDVLMNPALETDASTHAAVARRLAEVVTRVAGSSPRIDVIDVWPKIAEVSGPIRVVGYTLMIRVFRIARM